MRKWQRSAAVVAIAALAGACGSSSTGRPASAPTTAHPATTVVTAPTSTTTTSTPEYSFDDSVAPPKLINTGTDYVAILKSLEAYGNWLAAHRPDPTLVARVNAAGTKLYDDFVRTLTLLQNNNKRLLETLRVPGKYTITSTSRDAFSARLVEDIVSQKTVNAAGRVTGQRGFTKPTTYSILVVRNAGRWQLAEVEELGASPST